MSNYISLMKEADMNIYEIAKVVDVDVLEVAMAVNGIGLVYYDVAVAIAHAMGCDLSDLYPEIESNLDVFDNEEISMDEMKDLMLTKEHSIPLMEAGLDPDLDRWYAIIELKSGTERRYRMSSAEYLKLQMAIEMSENTDGFFVFQADCRSVILRKSSASEITFRNTASYAPFSTDESGDRITVVFSDFPRPEEVIVPPDEKDEDARPLTDALVAAMEGTPLRPFLMIQDEDDMKYVNIDKMEIMEIPLGLTMPYLYDLPSEHDEDENSGDLKDMVTLGSA